MVSVEMSRFEIWRTEVRAKVHGERPVVGGLTNVQ